MRCGRNSDWECEMVDNKLGYGNGMKWLLALCAFVAGCSTTPVSYTEATPVPTERVLVKQIARSSDSARVTVTRDAGLQGTPCNFRLFVDGHAVALLKNGERFDVWLEPGDHVFGARADGHCIGGTAETSVVLTAKRWKRLRISSGQDGTLQMSATAF